MKLLQDITLGQYFPGRSFIHRLDPRTKIISILILIVAILSADDRITLLSTALFILLAAKMTGFPIFFILRGMRLFFWLFAFTALFHLFFTPGDIYPPFPIWGVSITSQGLHNGVTVFSQLLLIILVSSLFTLTTSPREITLGLEKMLRPIRIVGLEPGEAALMVALVIRFIPVMREEAMKMVNARKVRGVDFASGSLAERAGKVASVVGPIFGNIFRRTDALVLAMVSRGFGQGSERGTLKELQFRKGDVISLAAVTIFFIFVVPGWGRAVLQ